MSGALTERAFVDNLERAGFGGIRIDDLGSYGLDELAGEPLFTPELIGLMRELLPEPVQQRIGRLITVHARKPA